MRIKKQGYRRRRGAAVMTVLVAVGVLGTLSMAALSGVSSSFKLSKSVKDEVGAQYLAEAGLAIAVDDLRKGGTGDVGLNKQRVEYGGGGFWVEAEDLGSGVYSLTSTAVQGRGASRVELVLQTTEDVFFSWGAFGDQGLAMSSNAHVDSYDSRLGSYDDQQINGSGSDAYASADGNIGSNASIYLSQNSVVMGSAVPGPEGSTTVDGNAEVSGSTTPASSTVDMPAIELPGTPSSGPLIVPGNTSYVLGAGDYAFDEFQLGTGADFLIEGPATIVFRSAEFLSNSEFRIDGTNGPVELFVIDDFVMNSNTLIGSLTLAPTDLTINLLSDNVIDPDAEIDLDDVDFESNAKLYGTIYAPDAQVEINSNFELFGSLVAHSVRLDSWSRIHFDEALLDSGDEDAEASFTRIAWRERAVTSSEISW